MLHIHGLHNEGLFFIRIISGNTEQKALEGAHSSVSFTRIFCEIIRMILPKSSTINHDLTSKEFI